MCNVMVLSYQFLNLFTNGLYITLGDRKGVSCRSSNAPIRICETMK